MKYPVTNNGNSLMFIGSTVIPPGETKHFPLDELPAEFRPAVQDAPPENPPNALDELLALSVNDIVAKFGVTKTEDLEKIGELEQAAEKPRKSLLTKIAEELLKRAADQDKADIIAKIPLLNDEAFAALVEAEAAKGESADADIKAAIEADQKRREELTQ